MKHNSFYIISQLLRGHWLIDPAHAQSLVAFLKTLKAETHAAPEAGGRPQIIIPHIGAVAFAGPVESREYYSSYEEAPAGSISILKVEGVLMKQDFWIWPGTATLKQQLQQADRHENISGHAIIIDSPGGTVDGTKDLADAIAAATKPTISYVDGLAASAGFWIASAADEIVASNTTTMLGSIGTMISLLDYRKMLEEYGMTEHHIFADKSADKNRTYLEALDGNYKSIKEQTLNPINEIFLTAVQQNLPGIAADALTGKTFLAQDAIARGMAHAIGDFEFALERLQNLTPNTQDSQTTNSHMFSKNKFPLMSALIGMALINDEALEAANNELEAAGISNATLVADATLEAMTLETERLTSELSTASARVTTLESEATAQTQLIASLTAERDAAQALATEYGAQPGASHTEPVKPEGDQLEEDANQTLIDSLPHNQAADQSFV